MLQHGLQLSIMEDIVGRCLVITMHNLCSKKCMIGRNTGCMNIMVPGKMGPIVMDIKDTLSIGMELRSLLMDIMIMENSDINDGPRILTLDWKTGRAGSLNGID